MKQNDDGKTVRAMEVLFPKIGEIIGGSQREEDFEKLQKRADEMGEPTKDIWWYLDTRRFGTAPHSGFGLGFRTFVAFRNRYDQYSRRDSFPAHTEQCRVLICSIPG
jgi:asparaginyl-tRNA synthetase